jgi:hypothetical protein
MSDDGVNTAAQDALNRMRRAHDRGTGCHLTAEMIAGLGTTFLAQTWEEEDPRETHSQ